jgi:acetylornithine deacetylase
MNTLEILERLVAFETVPEASNLDLLAYIEEIVAPLQPRLRRFPSPCGTKANLFLSLGPDGPGGLILSGHTDVVSAANQAWSGNPFALRRIGDRLLGRGATDMKGFLACCLAALPDAVAGGLARPLHLALSYDEEVGCTGVVSMTDWLRCSGLAPALAVIGEPSRLGLVNAHKGGVVGRVEVTGVPGHSSQPDRGVNAVMVAGAALGAFDALETAMRAGPQNDGFDPPWSTVQVNMIAGGEARNILAGHCGFAWEMRLLPGIDPDETLAALQADIRARTATRLNPAHPTAGLRFLTEMRIPALRPESTEIEAPLLALLGQDRAKAVPFGTEAGQFQAAGAPAVVMGPGDIAQAHQPDEYIDAAQLAACDALLPRLIAMHCH